jgi:hypothetical protein
MTDPNHATLQLWPLVIAIEDCYVPEFAPLLIEQVSQIREEVRVTLISCMVEMAKVMLEVNRN